MALRVMICAALLPQRGNDRHTGQKARCVLDAAMLPMSLRQYAAAACRHCCRCLFSPCYCRCAAAVCHYAYVAATLLIDAADAALAARAIADTLRRHAERAPLRCLRYADDFATMFSLMSFHILIDTPCRCCRYADY